MPASAAFLSLALRRSGCVPARVSTVLREEVELKEDSETEAVSVR